MTLCFIPARGGSKRIPRKNVRALGGKPLIAWTIECARRAGIFADIVVSSEDDEVLSIAAEFGARADRRPIELGGDRVRFVEVLEEFLRRPENAGRYAEVMALLPTCPFRAPEDILAVADLRKTHPEACVVSVSGYEFPPEFACDLDPGSGVLTLREPAVYARSTQSQSVRPAFHPNGAIFAASVECFLKTQSFYGGALLGSVMPPERALDLDHPHQWALAEWVAGSRL
jgi:CMP-N-acetylneuraminic acid synthetase